MKPKINVARWQPHLAAAKRQGKSMAAYAAEHGLSRHTLYAAAKALRENDHAGGTRARRRGKEAPAFAQVHVAAVQPSLTEQLRLRAQLPNGVVLHFDAAGSPAQLAGWLAALGALACSV